MLNENKILEVYTKRNEMLVYESYYTGNLFLLLFQDIEDCYNSFTSGHEYEWKTNILMDRVHAAIYQCVLGYKNKEEYRTNSAISTLHPLFQDVSKRVQLFKELDPAHLSSLRDALAYLNE